MYHVTGKYCDDVISCDIPVGVTNIPNHDLTSVLFNDSVVLFVSVK